MSPRDVLAFVKAYPFRPFRIRTASGREYPVRHPEMVHVGETDVEIFLYTRNEPDALDKRVTVPLDRIESIGHSKPTVV